MQHTPYPPTRRNSRNTRTNGQKQRPRFHYGCTRDGCPCGSTTPREAHAEDQAAADEGVAA